MTHYPLGEKHDYCITCGVVDCESNDDMIFTKCTTCGDLVCDVCVSKRGQCGCCVKYNLSSNFIITGAPGAVRIKENTPEVNVSITKYWGLGHHYMVKVYEFDGWRVEKNFLRPSYISAWVGRMLVKHYGKTETVYVSFTSLQGGDRRWFYRDGD